MCWSFAVIDTLNSGYPVLTDTFLWGKILESVHDNRFMDVSVSLLSLSLYWWRLCLSGFYIAVNFTQNILTDIDILTVEATTSFRINQPYLTKRAKWHTSITSTAAASCGRRRCSRYCYWSARWARQRLTPARSKHGATGSALLAVPANQTNCRQSVKTVATTTLSSTWRSSSEFNTSISVNFWGPKKWQIEWPDWIRRIFHKGRHNACMRRRFLCSKQYPERGGGGSAGLMWWMIDAGARSWLLWANIEWFAAIFQDELRSGVISL